MSSAVKSPIPHDVGTKYNLPEEIRRIANLRSEVVAWTTLDEKHIGSLRETVFCMSLAPFLVLPCFWPHACLLSPCIAGGAIVQANNIEATYWILTETELRIVTKDHDQLCCPGLLKSGNITKAIPLENITDASVDQKGMGCIQKKIGDFSYVHVDTPSSSGKSGHEATGVALKHPEWFVRELLDRRDLVKGIGPQANTMDRMSVEARGGDKDAASRIKELTELRDQGLITSDEYETKRKQIVSSI